MPKKPNLFAHTVVMTLLLIPSALIAGVGIFLCLTIVGIPVGFPMMLASGGPMAWSHRRYIKRKVAWEMAQEEKEEGPERFRTRRGKGGQVYTTMDPYTEYEYDPALDTMVPMEKPWHTEN